MLLDARLNEYLSAEWPYESMSKFRTPFIRQLDSADSAVSEDGQTYPIALALQSSAHALFDVHGIHHLTIEACPF